MESSSSDSAFQAPPKMARMATTLDPVAAAAAFYNPSDASAWHPYMSNATAMDPQMQAYLEHQQRMLQMYSSWPTQTSPMMYPGVTFPTPPPDYSSAASTVSTASTSSASVHRLSPDPNTPAPPTGGYQITPTGRPAEAAAANGSRKRKHADPEDDLVEDEEETEASDDSVKTAVDVVMLGNDSFCKVQGRLCVVGNPRTYDVTLQEILRRISPPECLNKSSLGPLLRRGKIKGCGDKLQELLANRGVGLSSGQKKRTPANTLTAFLEGEAIEFGKDNREMTHKYFPSEQVARCILNSMPHAAAEDCLKHAMNTTDIIKEQIDLQVAWCGDPMNVERMCEDSNPIRNFALVTHVLGPMEWRTYAEVLRKFADAIEKHLKAYFDHLVITQTYVYPNQVICLPQVADSDHVIRRELDSNQLKTFCEVPGRLTLHNRKFNISVAEIGRRVKTPECLNGSILGAILRKGKTKDNGNALRDELRKYAIELPIGRRKATSTTTFTSLMEEEALILARDMRAIMQKHFPVDAIAKELNERSKYHEANNKLLERRVKLQSVLEISSMLFTFLTNTQVPVSDRMPEVRSEHEHILEPFSIMTHGYGPDEMINWVETIAELSKAQISMLPHSPTGAGAAFY